MKQLQNAIIILVAILSPGFAIAQCPNDNALVAGSLTPSGVGQTNTQNYNANQYMLAFVESGANYTVATCATSGWDTQITVYNDLTGAFVAYNDDFCGLRSTVSFTPNFCGYVRVLLDRYFCASSANDAGIVAMTMNTAGSGSPTLTAAPDANVCNGQPSSVGIASNGTGGTPPYTYSWLPTTNLSSPTQSSSAVTTVTATTVYTLTITDANGCLDMDTVTVTMLPAPVVFLGNDTTVCGLGYTLDAGNPGASYLWSTGAGTQQINITGSGVYSVAVQDPSGCIANDAINVTLNTPPPYTLGNDTSSCGNSVVLDAGSPYLTYAWSDGATTQTTTVTVSDTLSVVVTDANGCVLTDTIGVTLNPAPIVTLGADTTQCGGSVTLDAGNPGALFFWSNSTSSQTTNITSSGTYYVDVLTQQGCPGSDTINVTINYQPVVNLGPDTSICLSTVILDAGNPGSTYLWSNSQTSQIVTVGSGTYSVTVTDSSGCNDADTIVVTTNIPPVVTASQDTSICPGGTATLTATGAVSYLWSNNATVNPLSVTPSTSTSYYVTGTDANGCQASDVVIVTMLPAANAQFIANVTGATGNFTNQSTNAWTYNWNFGDASPTSNAQNPTHTYTANGTYTVTLTVTGACGTDTYTQVVTITEVGIEDADLANTLSIYPNPNDGHFTVSFEFAEAKDVSIVLTDAAGRMVTNDEQYNVMNYKREFGNEELANGIYLITITTAEGSVTRKVSIQE